MSPRPGDAKIMWGPQTLNTDNRTFAIGQVASLGAGGQQMAVSLSVQAAGYWQLQNQTDTSSPIEYYVVVDLGGSTVSPGIMVADDSENRGYYTHAVDIQMSLGPPPGGDPAGGTSGDYDIDTYTPQASPATGTGSVSSGSSANIGFFGTQLTAGAGVSTSEGGSRTYQDYEVEDKTDKTGKVTGSKQVWSHLELRVCDVGPYMSPFSLIGPDNYLGGLPPRATSDLPLTSAASFVATIPAGQPPPGNALLTVTIKQWLAKIIWWNTVENPTLPDFGQTVQGVGPTFQWSTLELAPNNVPIDSYDVTKGPGMNHVPLGFWIAWPWSNQTTFGYRVQWDSPGGLLDVS